MGFESLDTAIINPPAIITPEATAFCDETLSDEDALAIVLGDVAIANTYVASKRLPQRFDTDDNLYRAQVPVERWPGTDQERSHLAIPAVMEAIDTVLLPQVMMGFFSDPQPFLLEPAGKTSPDAARAMTHLLNWAVKTSGFKEETRKMIKSSLLYGQLLAKYGYRLDFRRKKTYELTADNAQLPIRPGTGKVQAKEEWIPIVCPSVEQVDLRSALVDAHCPSHDAQLAKFIVFQRFLNGYELDDLSDDPTYKNIPTRSELREILSSPGETAEDSLRSVKTWSWRENQKEFAENTTSVDPLMTPIEILEYWSDDRVISVLNRKIVIRNEYNEFAEKPFRSCAFIDVLNSFYGFGIGFLLEGEQYLQAGAVNLWIDGASLNLMPIFQREKGMGTTSQSVNVAPGKIVNDGGEIKAIDTPDVGESALRLIEASEQRASRRVGANYGPEMPTQAMRTAEGVNAFTSGVQIRLQYFIEQFADQVFIPLLEKMIELCKDHLDPEQVNSILSEKDGKAFEGNIIDVYNGTFQVRTLTSTKLAARRAAAQLVPMLLQFVGAQPVQEALNVQAKKFDFVEFLSQVMDIAGWDAGNLVVDMTADDQKRAMLRNQAAMQAAGKVTQVAAQHNADMELEQLKGDTRAGNTVVKKLLEENSPESQAQPLSNQPSAQ